ncbi:MAG: heme-binding protein [Chthoniobacteraceae bacterium]
MKSLLPAFIPALFAACAFADAAPPPLPEWIWHDHQAGEVAPRSGQAEVVFMRATFTLPGAPQHAELKVCGDDEATVFLNGKQIVVAKQKPADWKQANYAATAVPVAEALQAGANTLAVRGSNTRGPGGIIVRIEIGLSYEKTQWVISDAGWLTSLRGDTGWELPGAATTGWRPARSIGKEGDNPWFEVMNPPGIAAELTLPPGFKSEIIRRAQPGEGSWVAMAVDDKGRLIVSPQKLVSPEWGGMWRFTLGADGHIAKEEKIAVPVGAAQGMTFAHGALYVNGYAGTTAEDKHALYRVRDSNGDDVPDAVEALKPLYNSSGILSSHGPHGVEPGPDGWLYHISGDYSRPVPGTAADSPHRNYAEDLLLPRQWDASGHALGKVAPMGTVQRFDREGKTWQLFAGGLRNPYGMAFNPDGEAFTYDADMEYDAGSPWYRPTRVYHLVSGGEYGHREGTGKWPYYYPDSLPPAADIGIGSPVGLKFGTGSAFPPKYQRALFMGDWAWGKIFAVHFKPEGASYTAKFETFAIGHPLNVVDLVFGADGAMYFITGGNDTGSALYRISYTGPKIDEPAPVDEAAAKARALRRQLEAFHGKRDAKAIDFAWPLLASEDRFLRYAARVAIEWQDPQLWHPRAFAETDTQSALSALLAAARTSTATEKPALLAALLRLNWDSLDEARKLELLRIYGVAFARLGGPGLETRRELVKLFTPRYPAAGDALNRELCMLLVFLEDATVVPKTMALLAAGPSQEQQVHYIYYIRAMPAGWTPALRRAYFEWFGMAAGKFRGGVSFTKFLANFKRDAIAALPEAEKQKLGGLLDEPVGPPRVVKPRAFVKEWKLEELLPAIEKPLSGRDHAKGKAAFDDTLCVLCHRLGYDGGTVGPDLTAVGSRFSRRDILESIVAPSKVVMEQYQTTTIFKKAGSGVTGRIVDEDDARVVLIADPFTGERTEVPVREIARREHSPNSPMPAGLINTLSKEDILDLVAYLEAGGMATHANYQKQSPDKK